MYVCDSDFGIIVAFLFSPLYSVNFILNCLMHNVFKSKLILSQKTKLVINKMNYKSKWKAGVYCLKVVGH